MTSPPNAHLAKSLENYCRQATLPWARNPVECLQPHKTKPSQSFVPILNSRIFPRLHSVARPVCKLLLPFLHLQKPIPPTMALTNQSSMLIRSIHTAFFILWIPPSISAFSLMYIDPKRPNTATQRMNRMASQAKRMAVVKDLMIMGRTA
jgi:hypothetical protein